MGFVLQRQLNFARQLLRAMWLALLLCTHAAFAQQSLSITDAINVALAHNRSLLASTLDTRATALGIDAARTEFELRVVPEATARTGSDDDNRSELGLRIGRKFRSGARISGRLFDQAGGAGRVVSVEISQPLFRRVGRLIHDEPLIQATQALAAAQRRFELQKSELVVDVVRAFENVLRLSEQRQANQQALTRAEQLLKLTLAQERLGRMTRIDVLRVELQAGQARARLENDDEQFRSEQEVLSELLGGVAVSERPLQAAPIFAPQLTTIEDALQAALANRLDYAQVLEEFSDTRRGRAIAERGLLPDLKLVARYEHFDDPSDISRLKTTDSRWVIGLSSDTDLRRSQQKIALSAAMFREHSASERIRVAELSIAREVQQRFFAWRRAHSELSILDSNRLQAKKRLELARRLFELGRGDNFTVTDAEEAFLAAQSQWLLGKSRATLSGYELLNSTGTLTETPRRLRPSQRVNSL